VTVPAQPAPAAPGSATWKPGAADIGLMALSAASVLTFVLLGIGRPIWQDDANAVLMARFEIHGLFEALRSDNNLPAYYVLLSFWMHVFGDSEPALRSLSVIFYLAGAGMVFLAGWAVDRSRRMGLYAALLYLASVQLVHQAHAVRMYTMLGFLSAASLFLVIRVFVQGSRSQWLTFLFTTVNAIGLLTHIWFVFPLFGEFLGLLFWARAGLKRFIVCAALSGAVFWAAWGPAFLDQLHNGSTRWIPPFHPVFLLDIFFQFYGREGMGLLVLLACLAPVVWSGGRAIGAFWRESAAHMALGIFLACTLVPLAVSVAKPIYFPGRYSTVALPALALLLGGVLTHCAPRPYALAVCTGILSASLASHILSAAAVGDGSLPSGQSDKATADYIVQHAAPGDCIVFTNLTRATADYYFRRAGAAARYCETSFPEELDRHAGWLDRAALLRHPDALAQEAARTAARLAAAAQTGKRIWFYDGLPGVSDVLRSNLDAVLQPAGRYELSGPFHRRLLVYAARAEGRTTADARMR